MHTYQPWISTESIVIHPVFPLLVSWLARRVQRLTPLTVEISDMLKGIEEEATMLNNLAIPWPMWIYTMIEFIFVDRR